MGEAIAIVHPDTGWTRHPELLKGNRYEWGAQPLSRNFRRGEEHEGAKDPLRRHWELHKPSHGTAVASVMIGGFGPDGSGGTDGSTPLLPEYEELADADFASGVAPLAHVIPQRVVDHVVLTSADSVALARAIMLATRVSGGQQEVGVISISIGGPMKGTPARLKLSRALRDARRSGIITCAAAGQFARGASRILPVAFPGRSVHTICAAACDHEYRMLPDGFYGSEVDITVPGAGIAVARTAPRASVTDPPEYGYDRFAEGTSYSTGMLAGACALWLARHGRAELIARYGKPLMLDAFKLSVFRSCDRRGGDWDRKHGHGVLDVTELLRPELDDLPTRREVQVLSDAIGWGP